MIPDFQTEADKPWHPLAIREVAALFANVCFPWWIAGGFAIEQFVGSAFRPHGDIDVLLLKRDATAARRLLRDWDLWVADPPGHLRRWPTDEALPDRATDVWCRKKPGNAWQLQLMFDNSEDGNWQSRRAPAISVPIDAIGFKNADGIAFLRPEIQLFYKAKNPRPKDDLDLAHCLPLLTGEQLDWLAHVIRITFGDDAPWLTQITTFNQNRHPRSACARMTVEGGAGALPLPQTD